MARLSGFSFHPGQQRERAADFWRFDWDVLSVEFFLAGMPVAELLQIGVTRGGVPGHVHGFISISRSRRASRPDVTAPKPQRSLPVGFSSSSSRGTRVMCARKEWKAHRVHVFCSAAVASFRWLTRRCRSLHAGGRAARARSPWRAVMAISQFGIKTRIFSIIAPASIIKNYNAREPG